jgi:hypothetical protein
MPICAALLPFTLRINKYAGDDPRIIGQTPGQGDIESLVYWLRQTASSRHNEGIDSSRTVPELFSSTYFKQA